MAMSILLTNPEDIANTFNSHYTTVAEKILKQRKYNGNKSYQSYLKNPNPLSFMMTPNSPVEVEDIITKLDTSKKTGPNSIPQPLLKSIKNIHLHPCLTCLICPFQQANPSFLKISSLITIYKKDSKLIVANYRPISLLSNINKILEKSCLTGFTLSWNQINAYMNYILGSGKTLYQSCPV